MTAALADSGDGPGLTAEEALLIEAGRVGRELYQLTDLRLTRIPGGKVNETFLADSSQGRFILQRLNDFFQGDESLGLNWLWIRLGFEARSGLTEPPLPPIYADRGGRYLTGLPDAVGTWRMTGFVEAGPAPKTPAGALEAARLLGSVHQYLNHPAPLELLPLPEGEFTNQRLTRPDDFTDLLDIYKGHPNLPAVEPLIHQAAEAAAHLPLFPGFLSVFNHHDVIIHGDPKSDNFLFSSDGRALTLLDWDTAGLGHVLVDLSEMLRSWAAADDPDHPLDRARLAAVAEGYAQTGLPLDDTELEILPPVLRAIAVNLCRRYLADALAEVYFKWDRQKFPSLHRQNLARAASMLAMTEYLLNHEIPLAEVLKKAHASGLNSDS